MAVVTSSMIKVCCNGLVQFNHDNMTGPELAVDLVNLANGPGWTLPRLIQVLGEHQIRKSSSLTPFSSQRLRQWTDLLRTAFNAPDGAELCAAINTLLDAGTSRAYLSTHDGLGPHLHWAPEEEDVVARVKAVTAGGLALFSVESAGKRIGTCSRSGCDKVFVDTSRNGKRTYCSAKCGNYDAVQRHRHGTAVN